MLCYHIHIYFLLFLKYNNKCTIFHETTKCIIYPTSITILNKVLPISRVDYLSIHFSFSLFPSNEEKFATSHCQIESHSLFKQIEACPIESKLVPRVYCPDNDRAFRDSRTEREKERKEAMMQCELR